MTEQLRHIVSLCGNTECVTFWKSDMIVVYEKNKVIIHLEPTEYCVTSAVYKNGILYYSVKDSNVIYRIDASKQILDPLSLYDYKEPRFLAAVNYYDSAFVIADGTGRTAVYDITSKQELHVLPVEAGQFRDFEMVNTSESIMLCHKWRSVARYAEDDDDETTIMMSFQVSNAAPVVQKRDSLRIYTFTDNWDDRQKSWVRNDIAMRLPIFIANL